MFDRRIYMNRRKALKKRVGSGLVLFLGHDDSAMNFPENMYRFRQDSSFLYYFGLSTPGLSAVLDVDKGTEILFGVEHDLNDVLWMGQQPTLKEKALQCGIEETAQPPHLETVVKKCLRRGGKIHFLPPYRPETLLKLQGLLGIHPNAAADHVSEALIRAVVEQRSIKIPEEIEEIEKALAITWEMQTAAMKAAKAGINEIDIAGTMEGIALRKGSRLAFPMILTINGQILHNHYQGHDLVDGRLLVNDSGAESPLHYASDITRTIPVGGKFDTRQREIYELVVKAQDKAFQMIRPGVKYQDVHREAALTIAGGLIDLGFLKGHIDDVFQEGIHALFFPHGLGHMLGLDVHDMESLGEEYVGYDENTERSRTFGFAQLRLGRELKPGFVLTVEPGLYFIPALIDKWRSERRFADFINYDKAETYKDFGGIRIEDDVLVTENGCRLLGKPIPRTVREIEETTLM